MNGKVSRNLRRFAVKETVGKPIAYTRTIYQNLKRYYKDWAK
jgi:hypothetical protein